MRVGTWIGIDVLQSQYQIRGTDGVEVDQLRCGGDDGEGEARRRLQSQGGGGVDEGVEGLPQLSSVCCGEEFRYQSVQKRVCVQV